MSNRLSMATIQSIEMLHRSGHSNREIARILGIDRGAVNNCVKRLRSVVAALDAGSDQIQNQPNLRTGSASEATGEDAQNRPNLLTGSDGPDAPVVLPSFPGRSGPKSLCERYREQIESKLDQGLSSVRIHQDLRSEYSFIGSYHSVRRFIDRIDRIDRIGLKKPLPFRRMEVNPGDEAQIDFGTAALVIGSDGKKRRPWMFRIVLSQSRKAYSEVVWRQTTDNFIAAIENAFHYFGGVPKTLDSGVMGIIRIGFLANCSSAQIRRPDLKPSEPFREKWGIECCEHQSAPRFRTLAASAEWRGGSVRPNG